MNRRATAGSAAATTVPRTRGDKPRAQYRSTRAPRRLSMATENCALVATENCTLCPRERWRAYRGHTPDPGQHGTFRLPETGHLARTTHGNEPVVPVDARVLGVRSPHTRGGTGTRGWRREVDSRFCSTTYRTMPTSSPPRGPCLEQVALPEAACGGCRPEGRRSQSRRRCSLRDSAADSAAELLSDAAVEQASSRRSYAPAPASNPVTS